MKKRDEKNLSASILRTISAIENSSIQEESLVYEAA